MCWQDNGANGNDWNDAFFKLESWDLAPSAALNRHTRLTSPRFNRPCTPKLHWATPPANSLIPTVVGQKRWFCSLYLIETTAVLTLFPHLSNPLHPAHHFSRRELTRTLCSVEIALGLKSLGIVILKTVFPVWATEQVHSSLHRSVSEQMQLKPQGAVIDSHYKGEKNKQRV